MVSITALLALGAAVASAVPVEEAWTNVRRSVVERNGINYNVFEDLDLDTRMEFVSNSGVCETTPGVGQHSGYFSIGPDMNMFFWFFEARHNPQTAPFAAWFNGGPGCSSLIGMFQENGPCKFNVGNHTEPVRNNFSWNEYANMLYVDQPIGVGFSQGVDTVRSTPEAAPQVYKLLQAFFKRFPKYQSREFGLFTESYGGHYGPEFAAYIQEQNAAIAKGTLKASKINLKALGINNGFYDGLIQYPAYIDYALTNKYNKIINEQKAQMYRQRYNTECKPVLQQCTSTTDVTQTAQCVAAERICFTQIEGAITDEKDFDVYDVREPSNDPYPPMNFVAYLNRADIQKKIGVQPTDYEYCSDPALVQFLTTGDDSRPFVHRLSQVLQRMGVRTVIWAGDADYICNYIGNFRVVQVLEFAQQKIFRAMKLKPYTVNGQEKGLFKTAGLLSWAQIYAAGHEVPYYQPATALQVFKQTMMGKPLTPT